MSASSDGVSLSGHWASGSSARRDEKKVQAVEEASAMGEQRLSFFLELSNALRRSVDFGGTLDSVKAAILLIAWTSQLHRAFPKYGGL